ncbi:hypothetical protein AB7942_07785 [Neobacillus sp. BF23-41]|uniref:hypothetical protein n=1 Tax=Neobacillus sp. BF23-41 TaxID=3240280 RepID=UPI0034E60DF9
MCTSYASHAWPRILSTIWSWFPDGNEPIHALPANARWGYADANALLANARWWYVDANALSTNARWWYVDANAAKWVSW